MTGIITDRDICMAAYTQGRGLDELFVNAAMAKKVISASPEATLGDVEQFDGQEPGHGSNPNQKAA